MRGSVIFVERNPLGLKSIDCRKGPNSCWLDHLVFRMMKYRHYGIDIGNNKVVHFYCESVLKIREARINICSLSEFSKDGIVQIDHSIQLAFPPEEVAQRAESFLNSDFDGYRVKHNNCEHFSMWCATGIRSGKQDLIKEAWQRCLLLPITTKQKTAAMSFLSFFQ